MIAHPTTSLIGTKKRLLLYSAHIYAPNHSALCKQMGESDCGLFAIATATALCHGLDPTTCMYRQESMREHFHTCLVNREMKLFPLHRQRRAQPQPVKKETYPVYCHCCLPWDKRHTEDSMTMCNKCKGWFHETCDKPKSHSQPQWFCKCCKN